MEFPTDLKYTKEHEWVRIEGNVATIGITEYAQGELGELVYIEVETLDEELAIEDVFGTVEAVKTTSDLFMPLSGKITEFNSALDESDGDNPTLINEDPYGEGWIIKMEISNPDEIKNLLDAEAYNDLVS